LTGELDLATASRARAAVRRAQDQSQVLICDLADLWFVDLTGLLVLVHAAAHAQRTGRRLIVANAPPIVPRMLEVLGLDDAFEVPPAPLRAPPGHPDATLHAFRLRLEFIAASEAARADRPAGAVLRR
jgi:anti-anti-sigma factor